MQDLKIQGNHGRCPYCKDLLQGPSGIAACAACGARQHMECYEQHQTCTSCGSPEVLVSKAPPTQTARPMPSLSVIEQEATKDGSLVYSWPVFSRNHHARYLFVGFVMLPFGIGIFYLLQCFFLANKRVLLRLEKESLWFTFPKGLNMTTMKVKREEIQRLIVKEAKHVHLSLEVRRSPVASDSIRVASCSGVVGDNVLTMDEMIWLRDLLQDWRNHRPSGSS